LETTGTASYPLLSRSLPADAGNLIGFSLVAVLLFQSLFFAAEEGNEDTNHREIFSQYFIRLNQEKIQSGSLSIRNHHSRASFAF